MMCTRALPMNQLMPAVGSRNRPDATPLGVGVPERLSGRTLKGCPHAGYTPSIIMSPDPSVPPDKAGRRRAPHPRHHLRHGGRP